MEQETDSGEESIDSDEELQRQFAAGKLRPGLNVPVKSKTIFINNTMEMTAKLNGLTADKLDWIERMDVTTEMPNLSIPDTEKTVKTSSGDVHDDFKREMAFYKQAQSAVQKALPILHGLGVKTKREDTYFAEMVKSDDHMSKIAQELQRKQQSVEKSEKAKKQRELKKYGKKVQREVLQRKQRAKKEALEAVKKYRKDHHEKPDFLKDEAGKEFGVEAVRGKQGSMTPRKSRKRAAKDGKFGFGGKKRGGKRNTAESTADMSSFKSSKHSMPSQKARKFDLKKPLKRLGKSRRHQQRTKK
eukprot:m.24757 g.24757  ORF g.24757 m.24757 type:complete len:301 (+) comp28675_c0_seq2:19-921(+)